MCHYQTLYYEDSTGYVIRCPKCEKIQVTYANLLITFDTKEFGLFRWWVKKIREDQPPVQQNVNFRTLVIPTPCEGMKLLLSPRELDTFYDMLEAADNELQCLELLRLFEHT